MSDFGGVNPISSMLDYSAGERCFFHGASGRQPLDLLRRATEAGALEQMSGAIVIPYRDGYWRKVFHPRPIGRGSAIARSFMATPVESIIELWHFITRPETTRERP